MSIVVICNLNSYDELMKDVKGYFDGKPNEGLLNYNQLFFSGWFLPDIKNSFFFEVTNEDGKTKRFYLEKDRKDVIEHFHLSEDQISCGFSFLIDVQNEQTNQMSISVCHENKKYDIWKVEYIDDNLLKTIKSFWTLSTDEQIQNWYGWKLLDNSELIEHSVRLMKKTGEFEVFQALVLNHPEYFSDVSFEDFKNFINNFRSEYWAVNAIERASRNKYLEISLKENKSFYCMASFIVDDINYLCFENSIIRFYVVQYTTNVLLFIPSLLQAIVLISSDLANAGFREMAELLKFEITRISKNSLLPAHNDMPARFLGINVGHARPYHYVYDLLHGVDYLSNQNIFINAVTYKKFDYMELPYIFDNVKELNSTSCSEINNESLNKGGFFIMPYLRYHANDYDRGLKNLSGKLNKISEHPCLINKKYDLVFWVGISVEKRKWIEQSEGLIHIINLLQEKYPKLCVAVDGRTSNRYKQNNHIDMGVINQELEILEKIKSGIRKVGDVDFISLIGGTMAEKIAVSRRVDVFLTHFLTDSMYVSAIQKKTGVVYGVPTIESEKRLHIHADIIEIPKEKIFTPNPNLDCQHQSVSMNWQDVYVCIEQALKKIGKL